MKPALLLVDLQNDYLSAPQLSPSAGEVVRAASILLERCRAFSIPVIHVWTTVDPDRPRPMPHWVARGRATCVAGTAGHATPPALAPAPGETVIHKTFLSAFEGDGLGHLLGSHGADTLLLAGVHLHGCLRQTALDAYSRGFRIVIAEDAVGSDDALHAVITQRYLADRCARFVPVQEVISHNFRLPEAPAAVRNRPVSISARGQKEWQTTSLEERLSLLRRLAGCLHERASALARTITGSLGKPIRYSRGEIARSLELLDAVLGEAVGDPHRFTSEVWSRRVPLGKVAVITPWNNPVAIPIGKILPAVIAGNTVVWKPSPLAADVNRVLRELFSEAGFPEEVIAVCEGGAGVATRVMNEPAIDAVTITGSRRAGLVAQDVCARRHIPLQAELGGNNAAIVWLDADLPAAASMIAEGAFGYAGQRCTANRRVIVDSRCYAEFLAAVTAATRSMVWGDPFDIATSIGPLVSVRASERVGALINRTEGSCRILRPQASPHKMRPEYQPPVIVCCEDPSHEIVRDETFGPVLVIQRAQSFEQALDLSNGVSEGLAAALFSSSPALQKRFLDEARAGILKLNVSTAGTGARAPFGGWKASGIGPAEHGAADREFYTRWQSIYGLVEEP